MSKREIGIVTMLCWGMVLVSIVLYLTNFGAAPDYAPEEYRIAMGNIHELLVLAPFVFAGFGCMGMYLLDLSFGNVRNRLRKRNNGKQRKK